MGKRAEWLLGTPPGIGMAFGSGLFWMTVIGVGCGLAAVCLTSPILYLLAVRQAGAGPAAAVLVGIGGLFFGVAVIGGDIIGRKCSYRQTATFRQLATYCVNMWFLGVGFTGAAFSLVGFALGVLSLGAFVIWGSVSAFVGVSALGPVAWRLHFGGT